jgi:3',5'-cyclic-AMP phosphodiesterase
MTERTRTESDEDALAPRGPLVFVQLSDPHVGAVWAGDHSVRGLASTVDAVLRLPDRPDAVLLTGDLADHAEDGEYEVVKQLMERIDAPLYLLPGNHDDRSRMRDHFDLPGRGDAPVQYSADVGPLRVLLIDSTRRGEVSGEFPPERLAWLESALTEAPDRPTLVAMHHPPFQTGSDAWDRIGLPAADRSALATVLAGHPQVQLVAAGHVHGTIAAQVGTRSALTAPSTYVQARLDLTSNEIAFGNDPPGFAVHVFANGNLTSHVQIAADAGQARANGLR